MISKTHISGQKPRGRQLNAKVCGTFLIKTQWNAVYVTSRLGCLRRLARANSPLLLYENMAYVQTAAASCTGEIPSCLDTDPEFQHRPFNSGNSNSVRLCLTLDRAVGYHQVQEGLLSASGAVELVKTSKMYIYTYYLPVTT